MRNFLLMLLALFFIALVFSAKAVDKDLLLYLSFNEEGEVASKGKWRIPLDEMDILEWYIPSMAAV